MVPPDRDVPARQAARPGCPTPLGRPRAEPGRHRTRPRPRCWSRRPCRRPCALHCPGRPGSQSRGPLSRLSATSALCRMRRVVSDGAASPCADGPSRGQWSRRHERSETVTPCSMVPAQLTGEPDSGARRSGLITVRRPELGRWASRARRRREHRTSAPSPEVRGDATASHRPEGSCVSEGAAAPTPPWSSSEGRQTKKPSGEDRGLHRGGGCRGYCGWDGPDRDRVTRGRRRSET